MTTHTKTIVYIEDEPEMIDLVALILRRQDLELVGATSGAEGLQTIQRIKPDLVMLDLMMPGMDGWEVYQRIKSDIELSKIPVAVVTARCRPIDQVLGLYVAGVQEYIIKPFSPTELKARIEKYLSPLN